LYFSTGVIFVLLSCNLRVSYQLLCYLLSAIYAPAESAFSENVAF
jgi:hypothetical protein